MATTHNGKDVNRAYVDVLLTNVICGNIVTTNSADGNIYVRRFFTMIYSLIINYPPFTHCLKPQNLSRLRRVQNISVEIVQLTSKYTSRRWNVTTPILRCIHSSDGSESGACRGRTWGEIQLNSASFRMMRTTSSVKQTITAEWLASCPLLITRTR